MSSGVTNPAESRFPREARNGFDSVMIVSPFFWNFRDDMWQTTHHIAVEFARLRPTVLVEPPVQWNPRSEQFRAHRLLHNLVGSRISSPRANLVVFHRRSLPLGRYQPIRDFDLARNTRSLRRFLAGLGFRRTLLWHSFPYWSEALVEAVDPTRFAYHCLDYSARGEEARLIHRADVVFCVSETLVEKHKALNPHVHLLPNGVDLDLYDRERAANLPRPADLPAAGRLIGFLGSINCHLDLELLVRVADAFPKDYLILVGKILTNETAPRAKQTDALRKLQTRGNVRFLGFKPTRQLPIYLQAFDVCLIPFLGNSFNQECDPLKFYEYTAMGKPVVTTQLPVGKRYQELCYVADNPEGFVGCVSRALTEPDAEELGRQRVNLARTHSWESLAARAWGLSKEVEARPLALAGERIG